MNSFLNIGLKEKEMELKVGNRQSNQIDDIIFYINMIDGWGQLFHFKSLMRFNVISIFTSF